MQIQSAALKGTGFGASVEFVDGEVEGGSDRRDEEEFGEGEAGRDQRR